MVFYVTGILVTLPLLFVEEDFPADPKDHYLAAWEEEFLNWKKLQIILWAIYKIKYYSTIYRGKVLNVNMHFIISTNHVFVLAHRPDVSSLSPPMLGPQQTMWESHCSATLEASGYDALQALDNQPQFPPVWAFWSLGRGPTLPNHWLPAVHAQGQPAQELCIEKKIIEYIVLGFV